MLSSSSVKGASARISWEALAAGRQAGLAARRIRHSHFFPVHRPEAIAAEIGTRPVAKVIRVDHPLLAHYTADGFALALQQFFDQESRRWSSFPHTYQVRDYAPALAARMGPGAGGRCGRHRRRSGLQAAAFAGTPDRSLPARRRRAVLPFCASRSVFAPMMPRPKRQFPSNPSTPTLEPSQNSHQAGEPFRATSQTVDLGSAQLIVSVWPRQSKRPTICPSCRISPPPSAPNRRLTPHLRQRLAFPWSGSRQLRPDRRAQALSGCRHLRSHSASGRHESLAMHRRLNKTQRPPSSK